MLFVGLSTLRHSASNMIMVLLIAFSMTDDSDIVLCWEIDKARAQFAAARAKSRKVESGVFKAGGFEWKIWATRVDRGVPEFELRCGVSHKGPWKCAATIGIVFKSGFYNEMFTRWTYQMIHRSFDGNTSVATMKDGITWGCWEDPQMPYNKNGPLILEFRIHICSSDGGSAPVAESLKFDVPSAMSNVILKIGEKKVHVSKEFLSIYSFVFEVMFFGDFAEKGKEEVELKDVVYEEFIDFLNLMYPRRLQGRCGITDSSLLHVLALADRFQVEDECLLSVASAHRIKTLKSTPEYANFSDDTKAAICDRLKQLSTR